MKKRKNNYQSPKNLPPRISEESSPSVQSNAKDEDEFSPLDLVKYLVCGPEKDNPKPLTFGVCLRRFFIVLDNLIAAALLYYVFTWIKFYSNGADTSFDVIFADMSTLSIKNVLGYLLVIVATWRWLYDSDSLPCLKNLTHSEPYDVCGYIIAATSLGYFFYWLRLLMSHGFDIDSISQPPEEGSWDDIFICDFLPYWAQEIRIVILGVVFTIRHLILIDTELDS